eukprot:SM000009S23611  [mRNA]  locus=s9:990538:993581:- [translate_table: standard]
MASWAGHDQQAAQLGGSAAAALTVTLHNGVTMPTFGLGTFRARGMEALQAVKWALEAGYRHIDTASVYKNEVEVGQALRDSGVSRSTVFITSKVSPSEQGYTAAMEACARSLERLQTTYLDLYLIHWCSLPTTSLRFLLCGFYLNGATGLAWPSKIYNPQKVAASGRSHGEHLKSSTEQASRGPKSRFTMTSLMSWIASSTSCFASTGKVKAIGVSNYNCRHLTELLRACQVRPMVNQVEIHPYLRQRDLCQMCKEHNIVVVAYASLGCGQLLSDPTVSRVAELYLRTPAQILLRWGLQKGLAVVIPKSTRKQAIEENCQALIFIIDEPSMAALDSLDRHHHFCWDPGLVL